MKNELFTGFSGREFAARALFTLMASAALLQASDNANLICLGISGSPVISSLKARRQTIDGRALMHSIKEAAGSKEDAVNTRKLHQRMLAPRMSQTDAVVMDQSETSPTEDDLALIEAARNAGIPVILENATKDKMAAIFGVGLDTPLVVADYDSERRMGRLTFGEPMHLIGVEEDLAAMAEARSFLHKVEVAEAALKKSSTVRQKANTAKMLNASQVNTYGYCSQPALTNTQCQEYYSVGLGPVKFYPYMTPDGKTNILYPFVLSFVDPEFEAGVYQVGTTKYARFRATGGWGNTGVSAGLNPIFTSTAHDRYPFFGSYSISVLPTNMPNDWAMDKTVPNNPNNNGQISQTSGWQVGATATNPPSVSASYGETMTTTITDYEWSVAQNSASPNGAWNYYMSAAYDCKGNPKVIDQNKKISDGIISYCVSSAQNYLNNPPSWSWNGNQYNASSTLAEVVWKGASQPVLNINYVISAKIWAFHLVDHWVSYTEEWTTTTSPSSTNPLTLDTTVVHN